MEWHTVNDNKCIIYYRKNSIRGKIPIIFLHGAGSDSKIFLPLLKELQNDCSFIVPDFPAHGRSEIKTIPTFDDYFNSISAIIEKECIDSFIAAGFSMGGAFAFELYCRFPNKIAALILISTGAILPVSDVVFEYLRKDYTMFCNFLVKFLYSKNADETIKKLSNEELLSLNPEILENDFKICSKVDYRNILKDIRIPVLIIANRDDKMVPLKYAEELANEISHSQLVIFETDGHMPHVENAKSTAEAIKEFYLHELD